MVLYGSFSPRGSPELPPFRVEGFVLIFTDDIWESDRQWD